MLQRIPTNPTPTQAEMPAKMIPVPQAITADCQMGMKVLTEYVKQLEEALKQRGVEYRLVNAES